MKYDVIVVGGGPGGAIAGKIAAENGLKTIVFERGRVPGEKNASVTVSNSTWSKIKASGKMKAIKRVSTTIVPLTYSHYLYLLYDQLLYMGKVEIQN